MLINIVLIKPLHIIMEIWRNMHHYFFTYAVSVILYDRWSLFIVKWVDPDSAEDADGLLCATQLICMILRE